jgi:CMP-N,N'-diacetyllegionaminic acid synthase
MPNTSDTIGIVAARAGSKSVKDKNLALLAGYPLIAYAIISGKMAGVERILFSSDSRRYCDIAAQFGAEVPFLRPAEQADDGAADILYFEHLMNWLDESEARVPEYWVHLRPTTPLRDPQIVISAITHIKSSPVATALRSAHLCAESPMKWFRREGDFFKSLAKDGDKNEFFNQPKQAFPDAYIPDGYVDIIRASHLLAEKTLHGPKTLAFHSPVCTEVDSQAELDYLQYEIEKFGSPVLDYMRTNFPDYRQD